MGEVEDGINEQLLRENERLENELRFVSQTLDRLMRQTNAATPPAQPNYSRQLDDIVRYLPQLTYAATNLSMVASALQEQTTVLKKIADHLAPPKKAGP